jgi:hypothetical protein
MAEMKSFTRWAAWEKQVLAKVSDPEACQKVILKRQKEIDADDNDANLVANHFRAKLKQFDQDPETCHVGVRIDTVAQWVEEATGLGLTKTKVTPYLATLPIRELYQKHTKRGSVWCWRGPQAKKGSRPVDVEKVRSMHRNN